ncbi:hypothetical protein ANN_01509 [Periplaneta americana]|uniref:Uncharacterized protein n=1 Tax=Periplaneta americana TaxID=6978 RepID=A0ABQ8TTR5_PERAM|nr:hypothetical protein ANN_01509 [Periplaneta americana]
MLSANEQKELQTDGSEIPATEEEIEDMVPTYSKALKYIDQFVRGGPRTSHVACVGSEKPRLKMAIKQTRCHRHFPFEVVLYGCETWVLTLREEQRLRMFENKVFRKIFGAKRDEVAGEWRKLHNTNLHALYSSPDIIRNIKSRRLRWAGHVARLNHPRYSWRQQNFSGKILALCHRISFESNSIYVGYNSSVDLSATGMIQAGESNVCCTAASLDTNFSFDLSGFELENLGMSVQLQTRGERCSRTVISAAEPTAAASKLLRSWHRKTLHLRGTITLMLKVEGKPRKKPQPGNLLRLGFEPGPPGFAVRRANRYLTEEDTEEDLYISFLVEPEQAEKLTLESDNGNGGVDDGDGDEIIGLNESICDGEFVVHCNSGFGQLLALECGWLFSVDRVGDSEMVFGEMWQRFRHRLPDIRLTVGENLGKKPTRTSADCSGGGGGGGDSSTNGIVVVVIAVVVLLLVVEIVIMDSVVLTTEVVIRG